MPLRIDILTLFPRMLDGLLGESILKRARQAGLVVPAMVKRLIVWSIRGLSIAEMLTDEPGEMIKSVRLLKRLFSYGLERADEAVNEGQSGHRDGFRVAVRIKDGT